MRIKNLDGATTLGHDGETYEADDAGMFDVPHEVGESLVGFPHWVREHEYVDQEAAARAALDKDPQAVAGRLAALESIVPSMQVRIQALEARLDELAASGDDDSEGAAPELAAPGAEPEPEDGDDDSEAPEKPRRARKTAASQHRK